MKQALKSIVTKVLLLAAALVGANMTGASMAAQAAPSASKTAGAVALYRELLNPVFSPADVYTIREVSIQREDLNISLSDGTIALMRAVDGHVTGAVFEGVGEVLLVPPDRAERTSLALFTQSAVLEQGFASAYFRFFDDKLLDELRAGFRQGQDAQEFITRWQQPANVLARADSLAILGAMTNAEGASSTFLHLRLGGTTLGILDLFLDTNSTEQISVAQAGISKDAVYYNTWTSFPMRSARQSKSQPRSQVEVSDYHIRAKLLPPTDLSAEAEFTLTPQRSGQRAIVVQLSRYLKVAEVRLNGQPVEFIQNEAMDGSDLARRGDDLVGVIFPAPLKKDQPVNVAFKYAGPVMFDTGQEVIYVGARGTWYPNAGPSFAKYDLSFEYPSEWSLVATGRQTSSAAANGQQTTHFVTDKLMARVCFNL